MKKNLANIKNTNNKILKFSLKQKYKVKGRIAGFRDNRNLSGRLVRTVLKRATLVQLKLIELQLETRTWCHLLKFIFKLILV